MDNGEWVQGYYMTDPLGVVIRTHEIIKNKRGGDTHIEQSHRVDPSTIGQFTGLLDKNGQRVWEGDIIDIGNGYHGIVVWDGFAWGLQIQEVNHTLYSWSAAVRLTEAIGNIHEPRGENDG